MKLLEFLKEYDNGHDYNLVVNYYHDVWTHRNPECEFEFLMDKPAWLDVQPDDEYSFDGKVSEFEGHVDDYDCLDIDVNEDIITEIKIDNVHRRIEVEIHVMSQE